MYVNANLRSFSALATMHSDGIWKNVAVPSRLYSVQTKEKPLAGKRISIKDNWSLAGVKTTLSSRPYEATYGPDTKTADFINKLLSLGAVVVGKSRMSAFASSEEPTDQWVDFHAPFNPRGDGYQTPAGSSNGAAAAVSGYHWLDYSIATDSKFIAN
jgi:Asp-tRNA(Asn)/Glu-tRNA(Gln) amidotransferase A subunit family amidase